MLDKSVSCDICGKADLYLVDNSTLLNEKIEWTSYFGNQIEFQPHKCVLGMKQTLNLLKKEKL